MHTNKLAAQSRSWLLDSFYNILREKAFQNITISEISECADLDRRTFYRHFKSKEAILQEYCQSIISEFASLILSQDNISKSNVTVAYFTFWKNHLDFLKLLERDNLLFYLLNEFELLLSIVRNTVKPEIDEGSITKIEHYHLSFFIGGFFNLLVKWLSKGALESPSEMAAIMEKVYPQ
ncbi:TetR family transcriptional regulator [Alkalibaculum sp. M08DMB]|uniref:TetR family transcriptional regulator n=1 Tax=Alkalibaculum sporogenes TaxID=2655001 RepID=A0A6A7K7C7_9FIRM|nr:TetR/AcrR family transcriptional regulator [Alkalibaculum sporogenes]MPW25262.1 TetR family transcriptional regulator [Alkalibaculum sporogenes]